MKNLFKIVVVCYLAGCSALCAVDERIEFAYLSENPDRFPIKVSIIVSGKKINLSAAPYGGFIPRRANKIKGESAWSVQIDGDMLEKDWPKVPVGIKIGERWTIGIERDAVKSDKSTVVVRDLTEAEADNLVNVVTQSQSAGK